METTILVLLAQLEKGKCSCFKKRAIVLLEGYTNTKTKSSEELNALTIELPKLWVIGAGVPDVNSLVGLTSPSSETLHMAG